jgi:mRNA interferase RelE/StbE
MSDRWTILFSDLALKTSKKMDQANASLILGYLEKKLVNCSNPRLFSKALSSDHKGKWRYRVGDYLILCLLEDEKILITVIAIGHRKDIYD